MSPQQPTHPLPKNATMERLDPDEQQIATVYRHPFGILAIYVQVIVGIVAAAGLLFFILPNFVNREENPGLYTWLGLGVLIVAAIMVVILLIATAIYHQSKLIITNKSITQITQIGLFNRKISQLAVSNIEDASAIRKGIFQTALNYGTLNIETAGETENFYFYFCPSPDRYAKTVLELREQFLSNRHRDQFESGATYASMGVGQQQYGAAPQQYQQQQQGYPSQQPTQPYQVPAPYPADPQSAPGQELPPSPTPGTGYPGQS